MHFLGPQVTGFMSLSASSTILPTLVAKDLDMFLDQHV